MEKQSVKKFNKKLIKQIEKHDLLKDIFGLTMGDATNFWMKDADQMKEILRNLTKGF
tara:strand:+ start:623 stop:793 length:171 start_codon:yes stop_codon:yes gene_type:complete